ncbi:sodium-dependent nutrient amino acid transporter 1-like [Ischnura elegans]|uniref:sodium-dependent nutrient amino acid transporter 1-like n=1 Tax=Ischnura elegans TaxID=197161 RepID=UPI001ED89B13|nr:sodium-dependent nutrient amino acid transporter 1-like [Ischnura elegans]XP_046408717.1 sodium-dependent nutrient amino acid transporter 1-like [Ischnura elegans]XP_046408722.1 sodium-dependent nutrient amino acid transporter 1-like [Ischnura elegans]
MTKDKYEMQNVELGVANPGFDSGPEGKLSAVNGGTRNGGGAVAVGAVVDETDGSGRQQWSNQTEFLLSCIAMSVGLGNVWRFPFTAYENGGGAFLIPYLIVLFIVGKPLYYMELSIGQFSSRGSVKIWEVVPAMKGIGYGQIVSIICVVTYYCSLMGLTVFYFAASFQSELPWAKCRPEWDNCFDSVKNSQELLPNSTLLNEKYSVDNLTDIPEITVSRNISGSRSSSELYFLKYVLQETEDGIDNGIGAPEWRLTLCLLFAWLAICLLLIKGVQSSGKAAYFMAIFPYIVLITLLIRGCTLPGAWEGISFFIKPKFSELLNPKVWYAAVTQSFFSLGVSFGTIVTYSSYNPFKHNVHRDAIIVTAMDTFTSLLAGFTIFSILGNLAYESGATDISQVVKGGAGLAFISYPDAIAKFQYVPQVFSVLFFLMLFTLGVGSAVPLVGALITVLRDQFPNTRQWMVAVGMCTMGFIAGLVYITPGGQYILNLVDYFAGSFIIFILAVCEIVAIAWIYGVQNFCHDVEFMLGFKVGPYWRLCWGILTPLFLIIILVYTIITLEPLRYGAYVYPDIAIGFGWLLLIIGVLQLPLWAMYAMWKHREDTLWETLKAGFKPSSLWGPDNLKIKDEWNLEKERLQAEARREESKIARVVRMMIGRIYRST